MTAHIFSCYKVIFVLNEYRYSSSLLISVDMVLSFSIPLFFELFKLGFLQNSYR